MSSDSNKNPVAPSIIASLCSGVLEARTNVLDENASINTMGGPPSDLDEQINKSN